MLVPLGLIVFGEDHFLIRGPKPSPDIARELVRRWIFPNAADLLGLSPPLSSWRISTREFREDIAWAIRMERDQPLNPAVAELLDELIARGVRIDKYPGLAI